MKRFVLLVATVLICCHPAFSRSAKEVFQNYSKANSVDVLTIDRTTFNVAKALIPMDKQTRKIFKVLNLESIDLVTPKAGGKLSLEALVSDTKSLAGQDSYQAIDGYGNSNATEDAGMIVRSDGVSINEMIVYSYSPSSSEMILMRIDCNADLKEVSELLEQ